MPTVVRFEDIQAWQEARALTREVYELSSSGSFAKDSGLSDQIRRAAVSIMSNIAEGFDRQGAAEFKRFLAIAKGSAAEVKSQMYVALDLSDISEEQFSASAKRADSVARMIGGLMSYLRDLPTGGSQTRNSQTRNSQTRRGTNENN